MSDDRTANPETGTTWEALSEAQFLVGDEDHLAHLRSEYPEPPDSDKLVRRLDEKWHQLVRDIHIRVGTLMKSHRVSFLLGAGTSREAGGPLLTAVPDEIEGSLLRQGYSNGVVNPWLILFYLAASSVASDAAEIPLTDEAIEKRARATDRMSLPANYEDLLSQLYRWRSALPMSGGAFHLGAEPGTCLTSSDLDAAIKHTKTELAVRCRLPIPSLLGALKHHQLFLKKILTRPPGLRRASLFTLNYDTLLEQAADTEGIVLVDGFVGNLLRAFRPESYDQDFYYPADTTEGRVHRLDRVLHLYKLHGSINWRMCAPDWRSPFGVVAGEDDPGEASLIYPTPAKFGDSLGMPYSELFRRFAAAIAQPQSVLFILGYGFGDEHVNAIIRQALAIPSVLIIIVRPDIPPASTSGSFLQRLLARGDRRVWLLGGATFGKFSAFTTHVLPDLREEQILIKAMNTHRALLNREVTQGDEVDPGGESDAE